MSVFLRWAAFLCAFCFFSSCAEPKEERKTEEGKKLRVLSTIGMIEDLVKRIGGEYVESFVLIKGDLDPHSYQLVKGDDEKLARADLIFYNGLGLEHGPSLRQYLQTSAKAIGLGDLIRQEEPERILFHRGQVDPHIWMDIALWERIVPHIVRSLADKDPIHAKVYRENGEKMRKEMLAKHEEIKATLQKIPEENRYLVTSHDAFNYFTRAYLSLEKEKKEGDWQKRFAAPEGLAPESQLSATDIQFIIEHVKKYHIKVLFLESNVSPQSIKKIAQVGLQEGLQLKIADAFLYADAMGKPGTEGDSYLKMVAYNAHTIARYLMEQKSEPLSTISSERTKK